MKTLLRASLVAIVLVFTLPACQTLSNMFNDNPVLVSMAIKQTVARFIEKSTAPSERAARVNGVLLTAEKYVIGNPAANVGEVIGVINNQIDYSQMSMADKLLIEDIFNLVVAELTRMEKQGDVPADQQLAIRGMITAARSAAQVYLE